MIKSILGMDCDMGMVGAIIGGDRRQSAPREAWHAKKALHPLPQPLSLTVSV